MAQRPRDPTHILLVDMNPENARGIRNYFDQRGGKHFILIRGHEHLPEQDIVGRAEGVIGRAAAYEHFPRLHRPAGIPMVSLGRLEGTIPYVLADYQATGRLALEHFASLSLTDVAFTPSPGADVSEEMQEGFADAAHKAGIEVHISPVSVFSGLTAGAPARKEFLAWLRRLPKPIGLLCPLVQAALYLSMFCLRHGLEIPTEIALLAGSPSPVIGLLSRPELSMVQDNDWQIGYELARLLDLQLRGKQIPTRVVRVPPVGFHEAASTNILAIEDRRLREAVAYIRAHACEEIAVKDVVETSGMSRRSLELAMQKVLGCSVHQEITRIRLARAKQLLRGGDMPISEIALECGLQWASSLSTLFTRQVGMSPSAYRKQIRHED